MCRFSSGSTPIDLDHCGDVTSYFKIVRCPDCAADHPAYDPGCWIDEGAARYAGDRVQGFRGEEEWNVSSDRELVIQALAMRMMAAFSRGAFADAQNLEAFICALEDSSDREFADMSVERDTSDIA